MGRGGQKDTHPGNAMTESQGKGREQIPLGQRIFDSPFLLLIAGFATTAVFYTLWGLMEILSLPQATLP